MSKIVGAEERDRLFFEQFEISRQGISRVTWDKAWVAAEDHLLSLLGMYDSRATVALMNREQEIAALHRLGC